MMTLALALAADGGTPDSIPWLAPTITVLTLLLGGGGIGALLKVRHDKRVGIAQQEVAEDDALSNRWRAIIEAQTVSLLKPMQERIGTLETKVGSLEADLEASRKKYWSAVTYIRQLLTWITRHLPPDIESTQVPQAPATLVEDI